MPNRPFAIGPEMFFPRPDGIFDVTVDEQTIGVFLLNEGTQPILDVMAKASFDPSSNIVLTDSVETFGTLEPGIPVLGFFRAQFGGSFPGKHLLTLNVCGDSFNQTIARNLFVVRSEDDPNDDKTYTVYTDIGKITTEVYGYYGGKSYGSCAAPTSFKWTLEYYEPFEGQFSDLPFDRALWKVAGACCLIAGGITAAVGGVASLCGAEWGDEVATIGGGVAAVGTGAVALDEKDPFRRGQENTVPRSDEVTIREEVELTATMTEEPLVGTPYSANVSWIYTRTTNVTTYVYEVNETVNNIHYTTSRHLDINHTEIVSGQWLIITAQASGPALINSNNGYFVANLYTTNEDEFKEIIRSFILRDDGHGSDLIAGDGIYTGETTTNGLPQDTAIDVFVYGFDMNNASESDDPLIAAQEIGGMLISTPSFCECSIDPDFTITVRPGYDPPIWGNIMVYPTPEHYLGSDMNSDGDTNDILLYYQNSETGHIFNTGLTVSGTHHAIDIYENIIAFVGENSYIRYYDINTATVKDIGITGFHPSIYENIIVFASEDTIHYFDLSTQTLIDTKISGNNPAIYKDLIVFNTKPGPTICTYDLCTGAIVKTGIIGENATLYETVIAFETPESSVTEDLNGDGDTNDWVICYYDLETQTITNTGVVGIFPTLYGTCIAFTTPEEDINADLNGDGRIFGNVIHYYDLKTEKVVNTRELGTEPDIYGDTVTFYLWENWTGQDLNGDGDLSDPILGTYQITAVEKATASLEIGIFLALLAIGVIIAYFKRKK
jgi:hypothetical protein